MPQGYDSIDSSLCFAADSCFDPFSPSGASPVDLSGACVRKVALFTVAALLNLRVPAPESVRFSLVALGVKLRFLTVFLT